jgi:hypothetical protein
MKTAIQELIEEMEKLKQTKLYENSFKAIDDCIYLALSRLEMEKEQIVDAYYEGKHYGFKEQGEEYYNETFNK